MSEASNRSSNRTAKSAKPGFWGNLWGVLEDTGRTRALRELRAYPSVYEMVRKNERE